MIRILSLLLLCSLSAFAQWSSDPSENFLICDHASEQALPKIAATSDGGCYITWWDLASGNYDVYLQRLNADGVPQWTSPCGILISDHPQDTWLTDWDMTVDHQDYCIIAVNDARNGSDRDITAYRISPAGDFVWGADGIAISNNDGFEPDPRILPMANGDIVFAWQEETSLHIRKVDANGVDVFNPAVITFTQANGVSIPRLAALDSSGFALSYLAQQGTQFTSPRWLYVRAYNDDGSNRWIEPGIEIMNISGIGIQMRPDIISDGAGGVYVYWYDTRNNVHHCYVQHIPANGVPQWTANGVNVDQTANELQMSPSAVNTGFGVVIFYQTANSNQSQGGIGAQYLSPTGQLNWTTNGVNVVPLSTEPCFNVKAFVQNGNYAVFFSQYAPGSAINTLLRASQLGEAGQFTWSPTISDLCNVNSEKGRPYSCINSVHQIIAAWPDSRSAVMDIYVQNVNSGGTLGPLGDLPPLVRIDAPEDGAVLHDEFVDLVFDVDHFDLDPDGDGSVLISDNGISVDTLQHDGVYTLWLLEGSNTILVELLDTNSHPLNPRVVDSVHVTYEPLHPSITITNPTQDTLTFEPIPVSFDVEDFVVSDSMGDGHIRVQNIRNFYFGGVDTITFNHDFLDPVDVDLGFLAANHVCLSLVDNSGNQLDPPVSDCVLIEYGEVAADPLPDLLPHDFAISRTYPNPFNSRVTIEYQVPAPSLVSLDVFDLLGRRVATLFHEQQSAGTHSLIWNADNFASGVYLVKLNSANTTRTQKILLLK